MANLMAALLLYYVFCAGVAASMYYGFRLAVSARIRLAVRLSESLRPIPSLQSAGYRIPVDNENVVSSRHLAA